MDLIDREQAQMALKDAVKKRTITVGIQNKPETDTVYEYYTISEADAYQAIKELPSVQTKKGQWEKHEHVLLGTYYQCSCCKEPYTLPVSAESINVFKFCPNCGADMREETE